MALERPQQRTLDLLPTFLVSNPYPNTEPRSLEAWIKTHPNQATRYHEHYALGMSDCIPLDRSVDQVFEEEFFDTPDYSLLKNTVASESEGSTKQHAPCWLRRRVEKTTAGNLSETWTYREVVGQNAVLALAEIKDLDQILLKLNLSSKAELVQRYSTLVAKFRTWRYYVQKTDDLSFWFDISAFSEDCFYVVKTLDRNYVLETETQFDNECHFTTSSKVVAFLSVFKQDLFKEIHPVPTKPDPEYFLPFQPNWWDIPGDQPLVEQSNRSVN